MSPDPLPSAAQQAEALGRNNVIVQIQGDGNRVVLGLPHLELTRHLHLRRANQKQARGISGLLSPYTYSIPFVGRDDVVADLEAAVGGIEKLYGMLKKRLSPEEGKDLEDLAAEPEDAANRGALEKTLRKRLAADPELRAELVELLKELQASGAVSQTTTIVGDGNVSTQIAGNQNQVWGRGQGGS